MDYQCYHCDQRFASLKNTIDHSTFSHKHEQLKFRQLVLNEKNGKRQYVSKDFHIIPSEVSERRQVIDVDETGRKIKIRNKEILTESESENDDATNKDNSDQQDEIGKLLQILPQAAQRLKDQGLLSTWLDLHNMIANETFPLNNICFLLFLDVVYFYKSRNTCAMRYTEETKAFWRTGFSLFHGKFLRFMGGPKNQGQTVEGVCAPGEYSSQQAKINFAIPDRKHLQRPDTKKDELKPGILHDCLDTLSQTTDTVKIAFDGKKINSALTADHGDINLFGHEESPTLAEREERKVRELQTLEEMIEKSERSVVSPSEIQSAVTMISVRIKELREMAVLKTEGLKKFKDLGQPDWRASKYAFVISSIQSSLHQINETINRGLELNDRLCHKCALMQGVGHLYRTGPTFELGQQTNYVCVSEAQGDSFDTIEVSPDIERYVLKQRSQQWFQIRQKAKVTGSRAHRALGLDTLKQQLNYINALNGHATPEDNSSSKLAEYLQHGCQNEIHAMATLVGKVLPAYYPTLLYVEEGCLMMKNSGQPFLVVSPDGSIRRNPHTRAVLAVEFKCPFGEKRYTTQVHYKLPHYYVVQVMLEMVVLGCEELVFLSYTDSSVTVFRIDFSQKLWEHLLDELLFLYGGDTTNKPTKLRQEAKTLLQEIRGFASNNVHFICEIPAIKGTRCSHETIDPKPVFQAHTTQQPDSDHDLDVDIEQTLFGAKNIIREAFELCRKRATEIMVFMMSDLDRIANFGCGHSLPVAYGLLGSSIKTETAKNMLRQVIESADTKGLKTIVFSCDGQFINLITKDFDGKSLTLLQYQKEYWEQTRKMPKAELVNFFREISIGKVTFVDVALKQRHQKLLKGEAKPAVPKPNREAEADVAARTESLLPINLEEKVDKDTYAEIMQVITSLVHEKKSTTDTERQDESKGNHLPSDSHNSHQPIHTQMRQELAPLESVEESVVLEHTHLAAMLSSLRSGETKTRVDKWVVMSVEELGDIFRCSETIDHMLTKEEVKTCCRVLKSMFPGQTKTIRLSLAKWQMLNELSKLLSLQAPTRSNKTTKHCMSLKDLAFCAVKNLPKALLCAVYAEMTFPEHEEAWRASFPYTPESSVEGEATLRWFSYPGTRVSSDSSCMLPLFGVCDSHHILTNLRCKCCSSGVTASGLHRDAWVKVAKDVRENKCGLSIAHVDDLIDKQNNAYAVLTFSEGVEQEMRKNGDVEEAEFCSLVRGWYQAEDDPGLDCHERHGNRLRMRSWLLDKYCSSQFPPPSSHVRGIPVVTFEALLTNIERKMQLYSFVDSYNPRAVSTLDAENFFSVLCDLAPGGKGLTIRPTEIPAAMRTASELAKLHADPNRPFHLHTSRAPVYPKMELLEQDENLPSYSQQASGGGFDDMSRITLRNHAFDMPARRRRRGKRKTSSLSGPTDASKGAKGIRQYHKVDETKILPHVRLGIHVE